MFEGCLTGTVTAPTGVSFYTGVTAYINDPPASFYLPREFLEQGEDAEHIHSENVFPILPAGNLTETAWGWGQAGWHC